MRKKTNLTIVEQAIALVPQFNQDVAKLRQQTSLRGQRVGLSICPVCKKGKMPLSNGV